MAIDNAEAFDALETARLVRPVPWISLINDTDRKRRSGSLHGAGHLKLGYTFQLEFCVSYRPVGASIALSA